MQPGLAQAGAQNVTDTTIAVVAVNGDTDTASPGTTCIRVNKAVVAACPGGYLAIPKNNKLLLAAALASKASSGTVSIFYVDNATNGHCPGITMTPCSIISIQSK